jgi:hypothetical protein
MSAALSPYSKLLRSSGIPDKFGTVIHLGAGPYFEEELYRDIQADRIVLIEADPSAAEEMRAVCKDPRVEIIEELIAPKEGMHAFHRFTLPSLNGLFAAGEITRIYPRVREVECPSLHGRPLQSVLTRVKRAHDLPNLLMLDVPGLEAALLEGLASGDLEDLDWVFIRGADGSLMEGAKPASEAIRMLEGWHYAIKASDRDTDSTRPQLIMRRDSQSIQIQELKIALEAAVKARDENANALKSQASEINQLKISSSDRASRITELESQVAEQALRQREIDEQMVRAEAQLEMLKQFMRPSLE